MGRPSPSKIAPFHGGSGSHLIGPTRVPNGQPNGILVGSAVLAGSLVRPIDRRTDHATRSVTIGRIYVRITAMRPNNNKLMTIYNSLHPRANVDRWYVPRKEGGRGLANFQDSVSMH